MKGIRLETVSAGTHRLLREVGRPIMICGEAPKAEEPVSHEEMADPAGYLPVLVIAAEALWLDISGTGFDLDVRENADAPLGYVLHRIGAGSWSSVMLCIIDVIETLSLREGPLRVNDLIDLWASARGRLNDAPPAVRGAA